MPYLLISILFLASSRTPHLHSAGDTGLLSGSDPGFATLDVLRLPGLGVSSLQLSQRASPPEPSGLETHFGLTWDIYFHSLQADRWREVQKTEVEGISNWLRSGGERGGPERARRRTCESGAYGHHCPVRPPESCPLRVEHRCS